MDYAAVTFWLLMAVFCALGVDRLWNSMARPKMINSILLPGTLVAQLGHILGLLLTGGTINDTSLIKDDDSAAPQTPKQVKSRLPVVGALVVALLPLAGCATAIYWVSHCLGTPILAQMDKQTVHKLTLPTTLAAGFEVIRETVNLVQQLLNIVRAADYQDWRTWLFLYLVICLTVRMAPLSGNLRGSIGAILLSGLITFILGLLTQSTGSLLESVWPLLVFTVAVLLLLLMVSLLIKGTICLVKTVYSGG